MVKRTEWHTTHIANESLLHVECADVDLDTMQPSTQSLEGRLCRYRLELCGTDTVLISNPFDYMEGVQCMLALLCIEYPEPEVGRLASLTGWSLQLDHSEGECDVLYIKTNDRSRHRLSLEDLALSVIIHRARTRPAYLIGYADDEDVQITLHDNSGLNYRSVVHTAFQLSQLLEMKEQGASIFGLLDADAVWQEDGFLLQYESKTDRSYYWLESDLVDQFLSNLRSEFGLTSCD